MVSIDTLLSDVRRAILQVAGDLPRTASFLGHPLKLASLLFSAEEGRLASERRLGIPVPRFCIVSVTWRCNLRCVGCYAKNYARGPGMSLEETERVIREASKLGSYLFIIVGGEPLLVPGLIEMLSGVEGAIFFLFTNGTLLCDEHAAAIARSRNVVPVISVEGDRDLTDSRRGGGVGAKVAAAMDRLKMAGAPFGFSGVINHRNLDLVTSRGWLDQIWDSGARFGFYIDYVPFPQSVDPELPLNEEDFVRREKAVAARYAEARPLIVHFPPDEYNGGCQAAGRGFIHINADGYVEPCPFSHFARDNVLEKPLREILASPFLTEIRELVKTLENPHRECLLFKHSGRVSEVARRHGGFSTERLPEPSSIRAPRLLSGVS